jgi:branched-chain amino acid transport system substrate-binding protein
VSFPTRRAVLAARMAGSLLAGCALVAGCTSVSGPGRPAARTVMIGLVAPSTGPDSSAGRQAVQGAQLAVDVVNEAVTDLPLPFARSAGLGDGTRLALVNADSAGDVNGIGTKAGQLVIQKHAAAVIVADSAEIVAGVTQQTEQLQVPLLDAYSSADYLTDVSRDWYFRIGPSDRTFADTAFALLRHVQVVDASMSRRVVLIEASSSGGAATSAAVQAVLDRAGFTLVARRQLSAAAMADLVEKVTADRPDVVFAIASNPQEAALVTDFATRQHGDVPVIAFGHGVGGLGSQATEAPRVLRVVGWSAEYARRHPLSHTVGDLYQQRFGVPMSDVAASAFTAVLTVAAGLDAAGGTQASRVRAALRQLYLPATQVIMPWDGIRFDANGQNTLASGVIEQHVPTGYQVVYPRELSVAGLSWPGVGR